jgi:hypothetical protein
MIIPLITAFEIAYVLLFIGMCTAMQFKITFCYEGFAAGWKRATKHPLTRVSLEMGVKITLCLESFSTIGKCASKLLYWG